MAYDNDDDDLKPQRRKVRKASSSSATKPQWIVWAIGIGLLLVVGCCSGVLGLGYFGVHVIEDELFVELRDNPKIREHLGELKTVDMDISRSLSADEDISVLNATGTAGSGELTVTHDTDDNGKEKIIEAQLRLPDGRVIPIVP